MKYLFYDIECAATYKGGFTPIYSIGYVLCDTNFNVESQVDLLINPKIRRNSWMRHVKEKFLAYDIEELESKYIFSNQYRSIKNLIESPNQIVFYYAIGNDDITYLNNECDRYDKDYFKFRAVNVCTLIHSLLNRKAKSLLVEYANCYCDNKYILEVLNIAKNASLDELSTEFYYDVLGIDKSIHRSDFDAYLTMMIVKKLSEEYSSVFNDVLSKIEFIANKE